MAKQRLLNREYHTCGCKMERIASSKISDLETVFCPKCCGQNKALQFLENEEIRLLLK